MIKETTVSWLEIPYITLTFCLRFLKPSEVPEQKVSALRGGLGEMLLRKNCVADRNCDEWRFQDSCSGMGMHFIHQCVLNRHI